MPEAARYHRPPRRHGEVVRGYGARKEYAFRVHSEATKPQSRRRSKRCSSVGHRRPHDDHAGQAAHVRPLQGRRPSWKRRSSPSKRATLLRCSRAKWHPTVRPMTPATRFARSPTSPKSPQTEPEKSLLGRCGAPAGATTRATSRARYIAAGTSGSTGASTSADKSHSGASMRISVDRQAQGLT